MSDNREEDKELVKQAIKEWMTEQKAAFGWWAIKTIGVAILTLLLGYWVSVKGISIPHG